MGEFTLELLGISIERAQELRMISVVNRGRIYEILNSTDWEEDERTYLAYLAGANDSLRANPN